MKRLRRWFGAARRMMKVVARYRKALAHYRAENHRLRGDFRALREYATIMEERARDASKTESARLARGLREFERNKANDDALRAHCRKIADFVEARASAAQG